MNTTLTNNNSTLTPEQMEAVQKYIEQVLGILPQQKPTSSEKKETHIALVLDASGSMMPLRDEIIGAFNSAVDELKKNANNLGDVTVTFITFGEYSNEVTKKYEFQSLDRVEHLTKESYKPNALTRFYDALGIAITTLEQRDVPDGVNRAFLVSVFTDGIENDSKEWDQASIRAKVIDVQNTGQWTITYAGANVNLKDVSRQTGMKLNSMSGFEATKTGVKNASASYNKGLLSYAGVRAMGGQSVGGFYDDTDDDNELYK